MAGGFKREERVCKTHPSLAAYPPGSEVRTAHHSREPVIATDRDNGEGGFGQGISEIPLVPFATSGKVRGEHPTWLTPVDITKQGGIYLCLTNPSRQIFVNASDISQYFCVGIADYGKAVAVEYFCPLFIVVGCFRVAVAVDFDDQPQFRAIEIDDETAYGFLA